MAFKTALVCALLLSTSSLAAPAKGPQWKKPTDLYESPAEEFARVILGAHPGISDSPGLQELGPQNGGARQLVDIPHLDRAKAPQSTAINHYGVRAEPRDAHPQPAELVSTMEKPHLITSRRNPPEAHTPRNDMERLVMGWLAEPARVIRRAIARLRTKHYLRPATILTHDNQGRNEASAEAVDDNLYTLSLSTDNSTGAAYSTQSVPLAIQEGEFGVLPADVGDFSLPNEPSTTGLVKRGHTKRELPYWMPRMRVTRKGLNFYYTIQIWGLEESYAGNDGKRLKKLIGTCADVSKWQWTPSIKGPANIPANARFHIHTEEYDAGCISQMIGLAGGPPCTREPSESGYLSLSTCCGGQPDKAKITKCQPGLYQHYNTGKWFMLNKDGSRTTPHGAPIDVLEGSDTSQLPGPGFW